MSRPHPALLDLAANRPIRPIESVEPLLVSAVEHRMMGMLWESGAIQTVGLAGDDLTALALEQLRRKDQQQRFRREVVQLLDRFDQAGLPALTFKGVAAEARWYSSIGDRPSSDIEIYVHAHSRNAVDQALELVDPQHPLIGDIGQLVESGIVQGVSAQAVSGSSVDLHFELPPIGVRTRLREDVWTRSRVIDLGFGPIRVLDPETALIQLLLHLTRDRFAQLFWYGDVVRLLRREEDFDWAYVEHYAEVEGLAAPIYCALAAVHDDLDLPSPRQAPSGWKSRTWRRLWPADVRLEGGEGFYRRRHRKYALAFMVDGRKREAFRWWLRQIFPPDPILREWYPSARGPYLWRLPAARLGRGWESYWAARRLRKLDQAAD